MAAGLGLAVGSDISSLGLPLSSPLPTPLFSPRARSVKQWAGGEGEIPRASCVPQTGRTGAGTTPWKPVLRSRTSRTILRPTEASDFKCNMIFSFLF